MNVITIEDAAFHQLVGMFETIQKTIIELAAENKHLKDDRLMSLKEVAKYVGFGEKWVSEHKEAIGYSQIGSKDLRFRKEHVDAYFNSGKHFIKAKN